MAHPVLFFFTVVVAYFAFVKCRKCRERVRRRRLESRGSRSNSMCADEEEGTRRDYKEMEDNETLSRASTEGTDASASVVSDEDTFVSADPSFVSENRGRGRGSKHRQYSKPRKGRGGSVVSEDSLLGELRRHDKGDKSVASESTYEPARAREGSKSTKAKGSRKSARATHSLASGGRSQGDEESKYSGESKYSAGEFKHSGEFKFSVGVLDKIARAREMIQYDEETATMDSRADESRDDAGENESMLAELGGIVSNIFHKGDRSTVYTEDESQINSVGEQGSIFSGMDWTRAWRRGGATVGTTTMTDEQTNAPTEVKTCESNETDDEAAYYNMVRDWTAGNEIQPDKKKKEKRKRGDHAKFRPLQLVEKEDVSHDTRRFTFALPNGPEGTLGVPIGQHVSFKFMETLPDGTKKRQVRHYTPITGDDVPGTVSFLIKVYKAGVHPEFMQGGKMSQHLDSLKMGDSVQMRRPNANGTITYHSGGRFTIHPIVKEKKEPEEDEGLFGSMFKKKEEDEKPLEERRAKHFGMIAGGTGITPMLRIIHSVLHDERCSDSTISLIYANKTENDILVREGLQAVAEEHAGRFNMHLVLEDPPKGWDFSRGTVSKDAMRIYLPPPEEDGSSQILVCGPPAMVKFACLPKLAELGYKDSDIYVFADQDPEIHSMPIM
ncbi:hypothetical protein ACHAWF_012798 [Thalassiosira exigua]